LYTIETDIEGDVGGGHDEHGPIRQHWEVFWVFSTPGFGCRLFALKGILADVWMHNIKVLLEMIQDFYWRRRRRRRMFGSGAGAGSE